MMAIAFIGLGNMGGPMAKNLAAAGHQVTVSDLSQDAVDRAVSNGCIAASSIKEAVATGDVVVTMLPDGDIVQSVYLGEEGILKAAKEGAVFIDSSTIDVTSAKWVGEQAKATGFHMVDAPVSGGVAAADAGTLTFMVGGEAHAFDKAKPVLDIMGKNIFHAGPSGTGQVAKIANNMLLGISMIATCEAFNLAERNGMDAQTFFDIASTASGQCWSMTSYCPAPGPVPNAPSNKDYQPGFAAAMMLKDLRLSQEVAQQSKTATPLGAQAKSLYTLMEAANQDQLDFSAIIKMLRGEL